MLSDRSILLLSLMNSCRPTMCVSMEIGALIVYVSVMPLFVTSMLLLTTLTVVAIFLIRFGALLSKMNNELPTCFICSCTCL